MRTFSYFLDCPQYAASHAFGLLSLMLFSAGFLDFALLLQVTSDVSDPAEAGDGAKTRERRRRKDKKDKGEEDESDCAPPGAGVTFCCVSTERRDRQTDRQTPRTSILVMCLLALTDLKDAASKRFTL